MTQPTETSTQVAFPAYPHEGSYVDWPAALAGAVVASGIAFVFTSFGVGLGLTMVSPYEGDGSATAEMIAVGSWMLWTTISSVMAGGYVAGRMRRRIDSATADEVSVRDGIHGLAVWGVAILLGATLLAATANTAINAAADSVASVAVVTDQATGVDTQAVAEMTGANEANARAAAETARKYSVISAFILAASQLIAGAAAYWAAGVGGQHRDDGRVFARFGRWV